MEALRRNKYAILLVLLVAGVVVQSFAHRVVFGPLAIENGMPCYAECGGMMYLSRSIRWNDRSHEMVGIIPGDKLMHTRPIGRGYIQLQPNGSAPWSASDRSTFNAHEFHYSTLENLPTNTHFAYEVVRGAGITGATTALSTRTCLPTMPICAMRMALLGASVS